MGYSFPKVPELVNEQINNIDYCLSNKSGSNLYSILPYKMGQKSRILGNTEA